MSSVTLEFYFGKVPFAALEECLAAPDLVVKLIFEQKKIQIIGEICISWETYILTRSLKAEILMSLILVELQMQTVIVLLKKMDWSYTLFLEQKQIIIDDIGVSYYTYTNHANEEIHISFVMNPSAGTRLPYKRAKV